MHNNSSNHLAPSDPGGQEGVAHDADAQVKSLDFGLPGRGTDNNTGISRGERWAGGYVLRGDLGSETHHDGAQVSSQRAVYRDSLLEPTR